MRADRSTSMTTTARDAVIRQSAVQETYDAKQAEASLDGAVDKAEKTARVPGKRAGAAVAAGLAAILGLGVATANAAPIYTADTSFVGVNPDNGLYTWRTDINNVSEGNSGNDSGINAVLYTGDTSDHYFTGDVGGFWQLVNSNALNFSAETWAPDGNIDPPALDPNSDMLSIFYDSPFNTLGNSKIEVQTLGSGKYTINDAPLPVPEPATLALLLVGAGMLGAGAVKKRK